MAQEMVGTRAYGRSHREERWFECALCGAPTPESETEVPVFPMPHAGLRVCLRASCHDEPSADYFHVLNPPVPQGDPTI